MKLPDAAERMHLEHSAESAAVAVTAAPLLCAVCSPFWWRHLNELFTRIGTPVEGGADEHCSFAVGSAVLPVGQVELLDALHLDVAAFDAPIGRCAAAVLFVQGNRLPAAEDFLRHLRDVARLTERAPSVLIMAGLSSDDDLGRLSGVCSGLGIRAAVSRATAQDDEHTLDALADFLRAVPAAASPVPTVTPVFPAADDAPRSQPAMPQASQPERNYPMASINDSLAELLKTDGATAVALVDANSGMVLGKGGGGINLDIAAAGNTEVVRAKLKTMKALGLNDTIEDILITLGTQYHIIRPMGSKPGVFIYLVLDRAKSNLAMARLKVMEVEKQLTF